MTPQELKDFLAEHENTPQENALDRWRREVQEREARLARERAKDRNLTDAEMQRWVEYLHELIAKERDFQREIIAHALDAERQRVLEIVGTALGDMLDAEREQQTRELKAEVAALTAELTEIRSTMRQLKAVIDADRREPVDLPALPRRELN
jgi:Skp family chaperone for outer membrane proteins